ncbi:dihydrolipoamide acetyltransferase [Streptacidiphilus pinicola]|uniref:Dihydrolipoamide acetyltransferase component of pyruvate dehydrogenase complex n=2 Tax=Streptacidiphilus pinicola TaxID=2219663 RepID=A0A2X0IZL9_9ACTN|nr:dihydrolipoamide acetyltransferase [Streptacidiphilus pinicola]
MPRLSDTMEQGTLSRWLKHEGDQIHKGDAIAEIETDKAVMELEAYDEGQLTRTLVTEGTTVPIGTPVALIGEDVATESTPTPNVTAAGTASLAEAAAPAAPPAPPIPEPPYEATAPQADSQGEVRASPLARRLAREHGLDIEAIPGSGPGGRVVHADVEQAIADRGAPPAAAPWPAAPGPAALSPSAPLRRRPPAPTPAVGEEVDEIPISRIRLLTAERLIHSVRQAPHFYLTSVVDAEPLLAFRAETNAYLGEHADHISVNDLIVKACATVLRSHPELNASWGCTSIQRYRRIHIGIAVALDDGLTVPVIHDADRKPLTEIAREAHSLAEKAGTGHLSIDEITGGTFTVSNLGPYGIDHFTAVINPPQAAILAVGAAHPEPVVRDGQVVAGTVMALTLSIDHRVLDGATGAVFLADLKSLLEQPLRIVV